MKKYIFIISGIMLFASCESFFETTLELEEPEFEQQLNINGILHNLNEEQRLVLSKTIGLNESNDSSLVNGAVVNVIYPDGSVCNLENVTNQFGYSTHNYVGNCTSFVPEGEYQLAVEIPGEELMASATATMPMTVNFTEAVYMEEGGLNNEGDEVSAVDLIINDPAGVENYYKFALYMNFDNRVNFLYLESNDALAIESANYDSIILSDDQFDGENYKLRLLFRDYYYGEPSQDQDFFLIASTISKDQYLFDKKLKKYRDNNDNPFASAIQLHDNIDGGLGIFAFENSQVIEVE